MLSTWTGTPPVKCRGCKREVPAAATAEGLCAACFAFLEEAARAASAEFARYLAREDAEYIAAQAQNEARLEHCMACDRLKTTCPTHGPNACPECRRLGSAGP